MGKDEIERVFEATVSNVLHHGLAILLLLAGIAVAQAAPNIPSSELPGRERDRFQQSPIDRFTQPGTPTTKPARRGDCKPAKSKHNKHRRRFGKRC
jgi:hypothetical protein